MSERCKLSVIASVAVVGAGLFVTGCEKADSPPASPASSGSSAANSSSAATQSAADAARTAGESVAEGTDAAAKDASDAVGTATSDAAASADSAADAAGAATSDATAKATELIQQATTYVKENKLDLAEKALAQLDTMKPKLPQSYHGKIDSVRSMLETAKKGEGLKGLLPK